MSQSLLLSGKIVPSLQCFLSFLQGTYNSCCLLHRAVVGVLLILFGTLVFMRYKNLKSDEIWSVHVEELHLDDPVEVIGQGSFGVVLLAGKYKRILAGAYPTPFLLMLCFCFLCKSRIPWDKSRHQTGTQRKEKTRY